MAISYYNTGSEKDFLFFLTKHAKDQSCKRSEPATCIFKLQMNPKLSAYQNDRNQYDYSNLLLQGSITI